MRVLVHIVGRVSSRCAIVEYLPAVAGLVVVISDHMTVRMSHADELTERVVSVVEPPAERVHRSAATSDVILVVVPRQNRIVWLEIHQVFDVAGLVVEVRRVDAVTECLEAQSTGRIVIIIDDESSRSIGHAVEPTDRIVSVILYVGVLIGAARATARSVVCKGEEFSTRIFNARQPVSQQLVAQVGCPASIGRLSQIAGDVVLVGKINAWRSDIILASDLAGSIVNISDHLPATIRRGDHIAKGVIGKIFMG